MSSQRVPFRKCRIAEIPGRIAAHAEPLHHRAGAEVARRREGNRFLKGENVKSEAEHYAGCLRRIAMPPMQEGHTPADFHRLREMRVKPRPCQSGKADERRDTRNLDGPQSEAVLVEMPLDAIGHRIAVTAAQS